VSDVRIEPFDPRSDVEAFSNLYEDAYGRRPNPVYVKWRYSPSPAGEPVCFGAFDADALVGFVNLLMWPLTVMGQRLQASQGGDTMVASSHRRMGLFRRLTERLLSEADNRELVCRFSIPGLESEAGYVKHLDHVVVARLQHLVRIAPLSRLGVSRRFRKQEGLELREVRDVDERFDVLAERLAKQHEVLPWHDSTFVRWKYFDRSDRRVRLCVVERDGELVGWGATHGGYLLDLVAPNDDVARAVLAERLVRTALADGRGVAQTWMLDDEVAATLRRNGMRPWRFKRRPFGIGPVQNLIVRVNKAIPQARDLSSREWRFAYGDIDHT
jgi:hypothetical protein